MSEFKYRVLDALREFNDTLDAARKAPRKPSRRKGKSNVERADNLRAEAEEHRRTAAMHREKAKGHGDESKAVSNALAHFHEKMAERREREADVLKPRLDEPMHISPDQQKAMDWGAKATARLMKVMEAAEAAGEKLSPEELRERAGLTENEFHVASYTLSVLAKHRKRLS